MGKHLHIQRSRHAYHGLLRNGASRNGSFAVGAHASNVERPGGGTIGYPRDVCIVKSWDILKSALVL